jgi:hypothetical protein
LLFAFCLLLLAFLPFAFCLLPSASCVLQKLIPAQFVLNAVILITQFKYHISDSMNNQTVVIHKSGRWCPVLFIVILFLPALKLNAQIPLTDNQKLFLTGDIRTGYFGITGQNRDGSSADFHEIRNRTRIGIRYLPHERVIIQTRYAIRVNSRDFELKPGLHTSRPGNGGLMMGEGAFDEAYLQYAFSDRFTTRIGRFQASYAIGGVISNAIIRNDSPNVDVEWTDGALFAFIPAAGWSTDLVVQWHHKNAPSNTYRNPLDINNTDTPFTFFTHIRKSFKDNVIRYAALDVIYSPDALIKTTDGNRGDYLAAAVKTQLGWELPSSRTLLWGGEIAYSFNRPDETVVRMGTTDGKKAGGLGFQTNLSIQNLFEGHNLGFIAAILEPSLLTSTSYWNNLLLIEIRHTCRLTGRLSAETRLRYRGDHKQLAGVDQKRWQIFPYARLTYRFR